jgi:hypothetical protein
MKTCSDKKMSWLGKLRFPLMQKNCVEPWKVPEACEAIRSNKRVEHNNEGHCSLAKRDIKESSQLRKEVGALGKESISKL